MVRLGCHKLLVIAVTLALLVLAGCGSGSGGSESGTLKATFGSFPDYLDPALSHSEEGWTAIYNTYIPLLTYKHASGKEGSVVIPGLARSLPKISADGKTYELRLRDGLRYSDGTPVKASDFAHAVERVFLLNSSGSTYYTDIVGAAEFAKSKQGGIAGIVTDDKSGEITIRLTRAAGHLRAGAGAALRRAAAQGHGGRGPDERPAARHRPLRDRLLEAGQGLVV